MRRQHVACSDDAQAPLFPWLGCAIGDLERVDGALLIGSHPRKDQPIANPACGTQRHRTVGRHPDGQVVSFGPGELHRFGTTLVLRLVTPHQRLDDMDELFQAGEFRRLPAHDPNRTVTAPDTELESPPDCIAREPNRLAASDQSRVFGLVTHGPKRILVVCSMSIAMATKLSRHKMWLS